VSKERTALKKKLVSIAKEIVRARDGNTCQHCGKWVEGSSRHCSHVVPVSAGSALSWEPLNMKILCYHCHINWWHKNPVEAGQWFRDKFPDRWEYLESKDRVVKFTLGDLEQKLAELQKELELTVL